MTAPKSAPQPILTGAVAGAVSGLVAFLVLVLVDHFIFSGNETHQYGLPATLVGAGLLGLVFGALIGAAVALTGNILICIITGAIIMAVVRLIAAHGFDMLNLIMGLVYGAVFGWIVASGVARSLEQSGS